MNQSQFLAITCNSLEAREKSRVHGAIGFGFDSHWLKNWRESFKPTINPFPSKGFPIDEWNRLALDRVKSISALSAHSAVKGLRVPLFVYTTVTLRTAYLFHLFVLYRVRVGCLQWYGYRAIILNVDLHIRSKFSI